MQKKIVSNTGPLISLEKLPNGFQFIKKIYDKIIIPREVIDEVSDRFDSYEDYIQCYDIANLIQIHQVPSIVEIPGLRDLDEGEIAAISLAKGLNLDLLIEEIRGRKIAKSAGINISGIAGQIGFACRSGIINKSEALTKLQHLLSMGRINQRVYRMIATVLV